MLCACSLMQHMLHCIRVEAPVRCESVHGEASGHRHVAAGANPLGDRVEPSGQAQHSHHVRRMQRPKWHGCVFKLDCNSSTMACNSYTDVRDGFTPELATQSSQLLRYSRPRTLMSLAVPACIHVATAYCKAAPTADAWSELIHPRGMKGANFTAPNSNST